MKKEQEITKAEKIELCLVDLDHTTSMLRSLLKSKNSLPSEYLSDIANVSGNINNLYKYCINVDNITNTTENTNCSF